MSDDAILVIRTVIAVVVLVATIPVLFLAFVHDGWAILALTMLVAAALIAPPFLTFLGVFLLGMFVMGFAFPRREPIKWKVLGISAVMMAGGIAAMVYFAPAASAAISC